MSSFFARSSTVKTPNVDYKVEGDWIDIWESKNPHLPPFTQSGNLGLTYSATCRELLDFWSKIEVFQAENTFFWLIPLTDELQIELEGLRHT